MSLLNSILHAIIDEGLTDEKFIAERTTDYEELKANVADFSPEKMDHHKSGDPVNTHFYPVIYP